jgi:ABC-type glycerol-3-phosphate transport system substrate-binding protein
MEKIIIKNKKKMKKVSLFLVMSSLIIACGAPSTEGTVPATDSTAVDTTAVAAPDSVTVDTTAVDTACNC